MEVDSNHRSKLQQIYSLSPLATRESIHIHFSMNKADDRTRTDNLLITNQLLCQLSHIGIYHQLICNQLVGGSNPSIGSKKPCGADTVELSESGLET